MSGNVPVSTFYSGHRRTALGASMSAKPKSSGRAFGNIAKARKTGLSCGVERCSFAMQARSASAKLVGWKEGYTDFWRRAGSTSRTSRDRATPRLEKAPAKRFSRLSLASSKMRLCCWVTTPKDVQQQHPHRRPSWNQKMPGKQPENPIASCSMLSVPERRSSPPCENTLPLRPSNPRAFATKASSLEALQQPRKPSLVTTRPTVGPLGAFGPIPAK